MPSTYNFIKIEDELEDLGFVMKVRLLDDPRILKLVVMREGYGNLKSGDVDTILGIVEPQVTVYDKEVSSSMIVFIVEGVG